MNQKLEEKQLLNSYIYTISNECNKKIKNQMEKNIFKIKNEKNEQCPGFFCKIPFPDKNNMISVFITSNYIINKLYDSEELLIENNEEKNLLKLKNRIRYMNKLYNITIIEIKEEDNINIKNYLELDDEIINNILNNNKKINNYLKNGIYIIQNPSEKLLVSFGIINDINKDKKYFFNHNCCLKGDLSGSPILNINNNKVLGIHNKDNIGIFLSYPIKKFILENEYNIFNYEFYLYEIFYRDYNMNILKKNLNLLNKFNEKCHSNKKILESLKQKYDLNIN